MRRLCEIHAKDAFRAIHLLGSFSKAGRVGNSFLRRRHRLYESPHPAEKREPTSGLENRLPEGSSYEALQGFAWACTPPYLRNFLSLACRALHRIALAVVSKWCQKRVDFTRRRSLAVALAISEEAGCLL
jgi:hypothetical protein